MAVVLRRFGSHWPELLAHLKSDAQVPGQRTLVLRPTGTGAADVALAESKQLMDMELSGSGSLNTRGTQLAGLTGATIALVATLSEKWLSATGGSTRTWLGALVIVSMVALFGAMYCAIFAVLPTSKWRQSLANTLQNDLANPTPDPIEKEALSRSMAQAYLAIAEEQRVRNQAKADDMLLAYGHLAFAVVILLSAAILFVSAHITSPNTTHMGTTPGVTHTGATPGPIHTGMTPGTAHTSTMPAPTHAGTTPSPAHTGTTHTGTTPGPTHTGTTPRPAHAGTTSTGLPPTN